ncbi:MAG: zinc metallopeptidase [Verrucomicrobia bacterium]|nr:zinc metallopeptidase [Verrucomicrobiota bacterium]
MTYILFILPALLLALYAQYKLSSTYGRYSKIGSAGGITGAEAAREILDRAGLSSVPVEEVPGHLTDHYDPSKKALRLSSENYHGSSIAAIGVAAHEAGHALQHKQAYSLFEVRMALVPVTQFATLASFGLFLVGMFIQMSNLILLGIVIYGILFAFQLVTLPVEYDASSRAKAELIRLGLVRDHERAGVSSVLSAAALTYVAAMVMALMQLLHWVLIFTHSRDRD